MRLLLIAMAAISWAWPAAAIEADATMKAWKAAPAGERADFLHRLFGKSAGDAELINIGHCMDDASDFAGHADLPIKEIATACRSAKGASDPV